MISGPLDILGNTTVDGQLSVSGTATVRRWPADANMAQFSHVSATNSNPGFLQQNTGEIYTYGNIVSIAATNGDVGISSDVGLCAIRNKIAGAEKLIITSGSITASVPTIAQSLVLRKYHTSEEGAIYGSSTVPGANNYSLYVVRDGSSTQINATNSVVLSVLDSGKLTVTSANISVTLPIIQPFSQVSTTTFTLTTEDTIRCVAGTTCVITMPASPVQYRKVTIINNNSGVVTAYITIQPGTTVQMIYISSAWVVVYRCSNA
jgi:hypothetical protein